MPDEERPLPACPRCDTISRAWSEAVSQRDELERELARLREALEWADAMIWPRVLMLERHNGDKPTEETSELRRILGPIRRAHKNGERLASLASEMERLSGLNEQIGALSRRLADAEKTNGRVVANWTQAVGERDETRAQLRELAEAARWALDLLDLYDERLAGIDSPAQVYNQTHLAGKAKAREALRRVNAEAGEAR